MTSDSPAKDVGTFLQGFNEIEAVTYRLLDILPDDDLTKHAKQIDMFKNRARFLQALLRGSDLPSTKKLSALLDRAISLNGFRNRLSHNPIRIDIFQGETGDISFKHMIANAKDGSEMPQVMEQLPRKLKEVDELVNDLYEIVSKLEGDGNV